MHNIEDKLTQVLTRIRSAAESSDKNPEQITLLAVSKKKPSEEIMSAYHAGQRHFGENYLQEAENKILEIQKNDIHWHFIGALQTNKCRAIATHFSWVHSVNRLKAAQYLSKYRPTELPPLNICLQVNIDGEDSKSGTTPEETFDLAMEVAQLSNIHLRGLMAIPSAEPGLDCPFTRMADLFARLKKNAQLANMDTLSMGMSADLEKAIAAGSTMVRVGTAIFGQRNSHSN